MSSSTSVAGIEVGAVLVLGAESFLAIRGGKDGTLKPSAGRVLLDVDGP